MNYTLILGVIVLMAAVFGLSYFTTIYPKKKKNKEHKALISDLRKGDEVITVGGFVGKIETIKEDYVYLELLPDKVKVKVARVAISVNTTAEERIEKEGKEKDLAKQKAKASSKKKNKK